MIRSSCVLLATLACGAALAGCSGTQAPPAAPAAAPVSTTVAAAPTVAPDAGVRAVFNASYAALDERDFVTACALNAPETNAALLESVAAKGLRASTCPEALTRIYATPGAAAVVEEIVRSARIEAVTVNGANATITWTATAQGQLRTITSATRLVDGQWRLVDTGLR